MGEVKIFEVRERLEPALLKLVRASIQKRLSGVISFAHYLSRQLHRVGIHGNIYTSLDILPDGFRMAVEYHIVSLDEEVLRKFKSMLYRSVYDYRGSYRYMRRVERMLSEGIEEGEREGEALSSTPEEDADIEVVKLERGDKDTGAEQGG